MEGKNISSDWPEGLPVPIEREGGGYAEFPRALVEVEASRIGHTALLNELTWAWPVVLGWVPEGSGSNTEVTRRENVGKTRLVHRDGRSLAITGVRADTNLVILPGFPWSEWCSQLPPQMGSPATFQEVRDYQSAALRAAPTVIYIDWPLRDIAGIRVQRAVFFYGDVPHFRQDLTPQAFDDKKVLKWL